MQEFAFQRISETVRGGFATGHYRSGLPGTLSGCIYRADGSKVELSERLGGFLGDLLESDNPPNLERPEKPVRLAGRGLYLGNYMGGHYGHFITENLSTFWIFEEQSASSFDYFLFHPFLFGEAFPDHVSFCFERFGIRREQVVFVGADPIAFDEIVVPERLLRLNHSADPRLKWVYNYITRDVPIEPRLSPKIYVSRRRFGRQNLTRVVANEVRIEELFKQRGYDIIYPEALSFEQQITLYAQADAVAGISGSGLHNSLFMRPGAELIEIGDLRYQGGPSPTQTLCNVVAGVKSTFIPFKGLKFGPRLTLLFNIDDLRRGLDAALGVAETPVAAVGGLGARIGEFFEIAFLSVRPAAGGYAKQLIRWATGRS
jgi:hypothetical protein